MPIQYQPKAGTILVCDYSGFKAPEMVKRRPVVVLSPQMQGRPSLCTIVPISTEKPKIQTRYHVLLPDLVLPHPFEDGPNWVKGDMLFTASFERLDLFKTGKDMTGRRAYFPVCLTDADFTKIKTAVLCSLGLSLLTKHLP